MKRYQAVAGSTCFTDGFGSVLVGKFDSEGDSVAGVFLIDLWCLGVKDAYIVEDLDDEEWERMVEQHGASGKMEAMHPACAKRLIEGAADYAQALGFSPARDFRKARKVLNGVDAATCPREFIFGKDGKPCFVPGPDDSEERIGRVLGMLENRLGPDGFTYEPVEDEDVDDAEESREVMLEFFRDYELNAVRGFYGFSGLMTALWISKWKFDPQQLNQRLDLFDEPKTDDERESCDVFYEDAEAFLELRSLDLTLALISPPEEQINTVFDLDDETMEADGVDTAEALLAWCQGFCEAARLWPEAAGKLAATPSLISEWRLLLAMACPQEVPEHELLLGLSAAQHEETLPSRLAAAVLKLRDALRPVDEDEAETQE